MLLKAAEKYLKNQQQDEYRPPEVQAKLKESDDKSGPKKGRPFNVKRHAKLELVVSAMCKSYLPNNQKFERNILKMVHFASDFGPEEIPT